MGFRGQLNIKTVLLVHWVHQLSLSFVCPICCLYAVNNIAINYLWKSHTRNYLSYLLVYLIEYMHNPHINHFILSHKVIVVTISIDTITETSTDSEECYNTGISLWKSLSNIILWTQEECNLEVADHLSDQDMGIGVEIALEEKQSLPWGSLTSWAPICVLATCAGAFHIEIIK